MGTIAQHLQQVHVTSVFLLAYCREARVLDTIVQHLQQHLQQVYVTSVLLLAYCCTL
jgi:hypothetical protein